LKIKRLLIILIDSIIIATVYFLAALVTGICHSLMLFFSSIIYGIIFFFAIKCNRIVDIIIKIPISLIIGIIIKKMIWDTNLFYRIFTSLYPEYGSPGAGTGLSILISFAINMLSSMFILAIVLLSKSNSQQD